MQAYLLERLGLDAEPHTTFKRVLQEMEELETAIMSGSKGEIAEEIADCILILTTIASKCNIDLPEAISKKMKRNYNKYNPDLRDKLVSEGTSEEDIMKVLKEKWDKKRINSLE
jgi:NTP pyrophosphatase (non-canonical NTP hydrolase)